MRILFLAPVYNNLYLPILKAMMEAGHEVVYIEDKEFKYSPYYKGCGDTTRLKRCIKYIYYKLFNVENRYWRSQIKHNPQLSQKFDLLFCIQGLSFGKALLKYLKSYQPQIKTALYVWDSCSYYDYSVNFCYFDKVATFDLYDSLHYNIEFLPFYWTKNSHLDNQYDISIVGTDHDGRLNIVENIAKQLESQKVSFYFRIFTNKVNNSKYTTNKLLSVEETEEIIAKSTCILDTDRETQTGTTPRIIWALASGKKVITTNNNLRKMPFYNKRQICIIDRENPIVDVKFILDKTTFPTNDFITDLYIKTWIDNFVNI